MSHPCSHECQANFEQQEEKDNEFARTRALEVAKLKVNFDKEEAERHRHRANSALQNAAAARAQQAAEENTRQLAVAELKLKKVQLSANRCVDTRHAARVQAATGPQFDCLSSTSVHPTSKCTNLSTAVGTCAIRTARS